MNIEFGCGTNPRKIGWKKQDIRKLQGVDYVCPCWEIHNHVPENSVDNIFSYHMFEHLSFYDGERTLESWYKILKVGGKCEIALPNMTFHINQWINRRNKKEFDHSKAGFWGWQRESEESEVWDLHKSGYDEDSLKELLLNKNFKNFNSKFPKNHQHLWITVTK